MAREETDNLLLQREDPLTIPLDEIGEECVENPYINWVNLDDPVDQEIAQYVSETLNKEFKEDDDDLHDPRSQRYSIHGNGFEFSTRGMSNVGCLVILVIGLVTLL